MPETGKQAGKVLGRHLGLFSQKNWDSLDNLKPNVLQSLDFKKIFWPQNRGQIGKCRPRGLQTSAVV